MNQRKAVLEYLKTHKKGITPMEALNILYKLKENK